LARHAVGKKPTGRDLLVRRDVAAAAGGITET